MKTFDKEYKLMAIKRVKENGKSVTERIQGEGLHCFLCLMFDHIDYDSCQYSRSSKQVKGNKLFNSEKK